MTAKLDDEGENKILKKKWRDICNAIKVNQTFIF